MCFLQIDDFDGIILGMDDNNTHFNELGWYTASKEAYIKSVNDCVNLRVNLLKLKTQVLEYFKELRRFQDEGLSFDDFGFITINEADLETPSFGSTMAIRKARISDNNSECNKYITKGVKVLLSDGNQYDFTYELEDQINFEQLKRLIDSKSFLNELIPLHASGQNELLHVTVDEFNFVYNKLIENKFYHLYKLYHVNEFVKELTKSEEVSQYRYEHRVPEKYADDVKRHTDFIKNLLK
ncbi:MAG: hypothetical protein LBR74_10195 [Eubacterium sp.]|jgi:hypothetical protein|nr:hypothetical protein [Eubacterium sp.]